VPGLRFHASLPDPDLYSPAHPEHVYRLELTMDGLDRPAADTVSERWSYRFAFRTFEARDQRFWLNGEDFYLRGINRHEDHPTLGPVYDADQVAEDVSLIGELGANFSRPGHYPNDVRVLRAFEDRGVLLAEEIPVYQWDHGQMADPEMVDRARRALEAMILRDHNRPAIVMWSVANEIHSWAETAPGFVQALYDTAKAFDPARPVMVAAVSVPVMSEMDESSGLVDVVGINEYQGWYMETTDTVTAWLEILHDLYPDRTVFISEYGAGALRGRHLQGAVGEEPVDDHSYSEEYQAWFHDQHISQFRALPWVRGFMPWVFADFRMQWTPSTGQPHPVERMNLKGLCDGDRLKKQAFTTVQQHFSELAAGP
jgi:beta-glucuronidase